MYILRCHTDKKHIYRTYAVLRIVCIYGKLLYTLCGIYLSRRVVVIHQGAEK